LISTLAARHQLPARLSVPSPAAGQLSYGPDLNDQYRRAAGYVVRMLKGRQAGRPAGHAADRSLRGPGLQIFVGPTLPYQVSWQSVAIKSHTPVHVLGVEAAVAVEAVACGCLVWGASAACASTAHQASAAASIVAPKIPSFVMASPLSRYDRSLTR